MKDDDLIKEINEFREASDEEWSDVLKQYSEDVRFSRKGHQWDELAEKQRKIDGRPCLTFNKIPAFLRQVTNEARMNKPRIMCKPVDDRADVETAKILDGMIRSIELSSNSDYAYDTAIDNTVAGGLGYIFITTDYVDDMSFEQDIRLKRCINPATVKFDPMSVEPDGSDQMSCLIEERVREETFKRLYPKADVKSIDADGYWKTENGIIVGKYWKVDLVDDVLLLLSDGSAILKSDMDAEEELQAYYASIGVSVTPKTRSIKRREVTQYVTNGHEVLETKEWAGKYIPVVPVYGEEVWDEDKREYKSLHRDAQDAQRMYNYFRTASTESVALQGRAPFVGPAGAFNTDAGKWGTVNSVNHAFIEYDGAEKPQRQPWAGVDPGSLQESMNASEDMKAIMGIYDASLGNRSNETSGVAISERKSQAGVATYHFTDNLNRSIRHVGRIIVDLIPSIYDTERTVRIVGDDGKKEENVIINAQTEYKNRAAMFDVRVGKYDVVVDTGPSLTTRRDEVAAQIGEVIRAYPEGAPLLMDVLAENSDWPKSDKVAKRFAAMLPDQIKQAEQEEGDIDPQAIMQERDQIGQQLQQAEEAIDQLKGMLSESQQTESQLQLAIEQEKNKGKYLDLQKEQAKVQSKQAEVLAGQMHEYSEPEYENLPQY